MSAAHTPLTDALIDAALRQVRREDPPSAYEKLRDQPIDVLIAHAMRMEGDRAELVAALTGCLEYMEQNCSLPRVGTYSGDRILAARAALAKATEGKP